MAAKPGQSCQTLPVGITWLHRPAQAATHVCTRWWEPTDVLLPLWPQPLWEDLVCCLVLCSTWPMAMTLAQAHPSVSHSSRDALGPVPALLSALSSKLWRSTSGKLVSCLLLNSEACVGQCFEHTEDWSYHFHTGKDKKSSSKCSRIDSELGDVL